MDSRIGQQQQGNVHLRLHLSVSDIRKYVWCLEKVSMSTGGDDWVGSYKSSSHFTLKEKKKKRKKTLESTKAINGLTAAAAAVAVVVVAAVTVGPLESLSWFSVGIFTVVTIPLSTTCCLIKKFGSPTACRIITGDTRQNPAR